MSLTLEVLQALRVNDLIVAGSQHADVDIALTDDQAYCVQDRVVADNYGAATLWATGAGGLTTFTHGFIFSDRDIFVELRTDNATPELVLLKIPANILCFLPGVAGGDTTESIDGAVMADGTDFDDVDQIKVQRNEADGQGDAVVSVWLFN